MSLPKRSSPSPPQGDFKHRVISSLNKLSDRDTFTIATSELDSIARNLSPDTFSPFLNCLSTTDSSEKSPVRRQCVRLVGLLSFSHGDSLSPHLAKMISVVLRRLRDPDSAVRAACIDAASSMASRITKPPFSCFLKPFVEAILVEQDYNSQIGASTCLAAIIEASPDPDLVQLQKLLPRLLKLVRNDCFKAKPALISLVGSIVSAGGASGRTVLNCLVPCLVEFLSSEDWAARKAAAETLARLADAESGLLMEFKSSCLASLESRRFDKVKIVRETMNRCMELWKEIPGVSDEIPSPQSKSLSSSKDNVDDGCSFAVAKSTRIVSFETPQPKKSSVATNKTPSSDISSATITPKRSLLKSCNKKQGAAMFCIPDSEQKADCNIGISVSPPSSLKVACEGGGFKNRTESTEIESCRNLKPETKRTLFKKTSDENLHKFGGLRSGSRVVPFLENDNGEVDIVDSVAGEDIIVNQKDDGDLSLIRKQLVQIENQQSSLLDLLQRFIGSSQCGITSLETRVDGIEKALDEISYDLAVSSGRISGNTCCILPVADFWSPKFWRRNEGGGHYSNSRSSFSGRNHSHSLAAMRNFPEKGGANNARIMFKLDSPRDQQHQNRVDQSAVESLSTDTQRELFRGNQEMNRNGKLEKIITRDGKMMRQICNAGGGGLDATLLANCISPAK